METNYFSFLDDDTLSVVLEYIVELNDFLALNYITKNNSRVAYLLQNNNMIYFNLLNSLNLNTDIKKFVIDFFNKNRSSTDNLTTYRQLLYAVNDSDIVLKNIDYDQDFLFDIQLIDINISILNVNGIPFDKIKEVYNLYLDNRYKFFDFENIDEGPPQLLIKSANNGYECTVSNYGYDYGDPRSDDRILYYYFNINDIQLRCLIISLLFNNYNIPLIEGRIYDLITKHKK